MGRWKRELQNGSFCIINKTWPIWIAVFVCQPNTISDIPLSLELSFSLSLSLCQPPMPTLVNMLWRKLEIHVSEYTARKDEKKKAVCPWILKWRPKRSYRRCRRDNCTRNKFAKSKCNFFPNFLVFIPLLKIFLSLSDLVTSRYLPPDTAGERILILGEILLLP